MKALSARFQPAGSPGLCGARAPQRWGQCGSAPGFPRVGVKSGNAWRAKCSRAGWSPHVVLRRFPIFFGIFLVKLGDELVAASHCFPALLLLGHTGVLGVQVLWERKLAFVGKGLDYDKAQTKSKTNKEIK